MININEKDITALLEEIKDYQEKIDNDLLLIRIKRMDAFEQEYGNIRAYDRYEISHELADWISEFGIREDGYHNDFHYLEEIEILSVNYEKNTINILSMKSANVVMNVPVEMIISCKKLSR